MVEFGPVFGIILVVVISSVHHAIVGYLGYDPSAASERLMYISVAIMVVWWIVEDAKRRGLHRPLDFAMWLFITLPFALPVYLLATRGWKGIGPAVLLCVVVNVPWVVGWCSYLSGPSNR